jgi:GTP cyclohydrolase I
MNEDKVTQISHHVEQILGLLGFNSKDDPELEQTPRCIAEYYLELFGDAERDGQPELTQIDHAGESREMILVRDLPFFSLCVHHFLPFYGRAHVAYLPGRKIIGFSSIGRLLDHWARRPQLQERLTEQLAEAFQRALDAKGVIVVVEAEHLCMKMRGTRKTGQVTTTAARGCFLEKPWRDEFFGRL